MMRAWKKTKEKWEQFRIETALHAGEVQSLMVNLALIGSLRPVDGAGLVIFVGSRYQALLISLLGLAGLLPRVNVVLVREVSELLRIMRERVEQRRFSVIASRLFVRYYQHLVDARRSGSLLIV